MMQIEKNISLKPYNTFGIDANAKFFVKLNSSNEIVELLSNKEFSGLNKLVLGGGSNVLFTKDFDGLIVTLNNSEIKIESEDDSTVLIKADAGVEWDEFVKYCVDKGFNGVENLSHIPGKVGAAPIQNIGAYGVEVKDLIESVNVILFENHDKKTLSNQECNFGYRNSVFKNSLKNKFIITSVVFKLSKEENFNIGYSAISEYMASNKISKISAKSIREAIITIRNRKLPDPNKIGNAGSFFKNPIIPKEKFYQLKNQYPELNGYAENDLEVKISAGWLIEKCGLKGERSGEVGVHEKQALVIVNYGNATGSEILEFSEMIRQKVKNKFNINIFNEVNII